MPLSHLGLTVSHIPSATSFYLAALQPLGYHYLGHQGDSIWLGINEADFFLCQEQNGTRVSPTHLAFSAENRLAVRDCYAAALNAGGRPSGAPSYRNNDCSCFNAAVEDLDGNTIEFIYRDPCASEGKEHGAAPSDHSRVMTWQEGLSRGGTGNDMQSLASKASRAQSRAQVALDLASKASKSTKGSDAPFPGIKRSRTDPVTSSSDNGGKAIVGTLLGAAAGAAVAYAMCSSERDNTKDEAAFASSVRPKQPSVRDSHSRAKSEKSTISKNSRRDYPPSESARSSRRPPRNMRAIEPPPYDDEEIQDVISRYTSSRRPGLQRSKTYDAVEYSPTSNISGRSDRFSTKRASTLPRDMPYYLEGPRSTPGSRYTSRRSSFDDLKRHDSGVSMHSHRSRRSSDGGRRPSFSHTGSSKHSRRGSLYESAAKVPLPPSKAPSYISAADMPLPPSKATSYISAAKIPAPPSRTNGGYTDVGEESDGLSDMKTVVPEDSISCVDFYKPKRKSKSSSKSSHHSSKRSEADSERTVRPSKPSASKHSAMTLPVRSKDEYRSQKGGKRSMATYA